MKIFYRSTSLKFIENKALFIEQFFLSNFPEAYLFKQYGIAKGGIRKPYRVGTIIKIKRHVRRKKSVRFVNEKRGSYDEIVANIKLLCKHQCKTTVRINYTKKNLPSVANIAKDFDDMSLQDRTYLSITFHKVWQEENTELLQDTVSSLIKYFRSKGLNALIGGLPDNLRNSCYADKNNHAVINYNGELFKCTARDFKTDSSEGFIDQDGTLVWNETYHRRLDAKFKNKPCLSCSILPICNGGCSQVAMENVNKDYCVHNFDETAKKRIVLEKFLKLANTYM